MAIFVLESVTLNVEIDPVAKVRHPQKTWTLVCQYICTPAKFHTNHLLSSPSPGLRHPWVRVASCGPVLTTSISGTAQPVGVEIRYVVREREVVRCQKSGSFATKSKNEAPRFVQQYLYIVISPFIFTLIWKWLKIGEIDAMIELFKNVYCPVSLRKYHVY